MTRTSSKGICSYCGGSYSKSVVSRHLQACPARKADNEVPMKKGSAKGQAKTIFHLQVEGLYRPMYWLHIEIAAKATLEDLDQF